MLEEQVGLAVLPGKILLHLLINYFALFKF